MTHNKVDFIIVGVHKCGTTSLFDTLCRHPDVHNVNIKEPHFFLDDQKKNQIFAPILEAHEYLQLFKDKDTKIAGESSVLYFNYANEVAPRIQKMLGKQLKIIVCLRNPIDRCYSAYLDVLKHNSLETRSFEKILNSYENGERLPNRSYPTRLFIEMGFYSKNLDIYRQYFDNVHHILLEDLTTNPQETLSELYDFLGISSTNSIELSSKNEGGRLWFSSAFGNFLKKIVSRKLRFFLKTNFPIAYEGSLNFITRSFTRPAPKLTKSQRNRLKKIYHDDVMDCSCTMDNLLNKWLDF